MLFASFEVAKLRRPRWRRPILPTNSPLVIDPEPNDVALARISLAHPGFKVHEASTLAQGLKILPRRGTPTYVEPEFEQTTPGWREVIVELTSNDSDKRSSLGTAQLKMRPG